MTATATKTLVAVMVVGVVVVGVVLVIAVLVMKGVAAAVVVVAVVVVVLVVVVVVVVMSHYPLSSRCLLGSCAGSASRMISPVTSLVAVLETNHLPCWRCGCHGRQPHMTTATNRR